MDAAATELTDRYWAEEHFGTSLDVFRSAGLHIQPHAGGLKGYEGVFIFQRLSSCVVSCPSTLCKRVEKALRGIAFERLFERAFLVRVFPEAEKLIGPAWVGYLAGGATVVNETVAPVVTGTGKELAPQLRALKAECDQLEWGYSSLGEDSVLIVGYDAEGKFLAAAGYERWGTYLAHIGVITHPAYRGRGLGRLVVGETVRHVLHDGLVPHFRTLVANGAATRIGESLGFRKYGESMAIRLKLV